MEYMNVKTAAQAWGISERRITMLCRNGRIAGAMKEGKFWLLPVNAVKPEVGRTSDAAIQEQTVKLRPLPIGVSDFKEAVSDFYYVDKTLLIKDFLDTRAKVTLFTRPRRFGKTLNMDMLRVFFEKTDKDTSVYFRDKKIWGCGKDYRKHQGKYPVIFLTFKDVKYDTWELALNSIAQLLRNEYLRHSEILDGSAINKYEKQDFEKIASGSPNEVDLAFSLGKLSQMLDSYYGTAPVIIIDEYDTPIQNGFMRGYYNQIVSFMRNLFSGAFKDNRHLSYGFLTGILRVAKESIFSGLNNLSVDSVLDVRYSRYFGFTQDEVSVMLQYYGVEMKLSEVCEWYDGYLFGETEIFNPWSVINYINEHCSPQAFWQSTGNNSIIGEIIKGATSEIQENLQLLMQGKTISTYVDTAVIYPEIKRNPYTIYSFLLMAGYLKIVDRQALHDGNNICTIAIPNKEIFYVYEKEILSCLADSISPSTAIAIQQAIIMQDVPNLQKHLQDFLRQTISIYDASSESFYHGLMLGLYAIMNNRYRITSNREAGDGRYDIQMMPLNKKMPGILIELKVLRGTVAPENVTEKLTALSEMALQQIDEKNYAFEMQDEGITQKMKLGIAFYKKQAEIAYRLD